MKRYLELVTALGFSLLMTSTLFAQTLQGGEFGVEELTVTTEAAPPPAPVSRMIPSQLITIEATETGATIRWPTELLASSLVIFRALDSPLVNLEGTPTELSVDHEVALDNLRGGAGYEFRVLSFPAQGIALEGPRLEFTTRFNRWSELRSRLERGVQWLTGLLSARETPNAEGASENEVIPESEQSPETTGASEEPPTEVQATEAPATETTSE